MKQKARIMGRNIAYLILGAFASVLPACGGGGVTVANGTAIVDIVFTFDKPYACGQFANGDWWVSPNSPGGSVHVVSITPDGIAGKHGVEINPSSTTEQAFDNAAEVPYNGSLLATFPRDVRGGSSIVKAVSILPNPKSRPTLQFAAVLTVLDTPLANSAQYFRPPYVGATKILFPVSAINLSALPRLAASAVTAFDKPDILPTSDVEAIPNVQSTCSTVTYKAPSSNGTDLLDRYTGVRLDHIGTWEGRDIHPKETMPTYGAQIATDNAVYLMRMAIDDFDPASNYQHKRALVNYLQTAIDLQAEVLNGTKWNAAGGHSIGRKLPLAFAEMIFTTPSIKAAFSDAISTGSFDEDNLLSRSTINNKVLYGRPGSDFQYWQATLTGNGPLDIRDPYGMIDGGGDQVGSGHGYQYCCTSMPWKYTALAIYVLNLQSEFNSPNLLEYAERWVNWGSITIADTCAPYSTSANYGITFGPDSSNPGQCIAGAGRWTSRDGVGKNDGGYKSIYGDNLWVWYKAQPSATSVPYSH